MSKTLQEKLAAMQFFIRQMLTNRVCVLENLYQ